ncbi:hypothetical protein [Tautonia rosea]|uniref:hypothetical protein n=1 Tax=Tautonia rosea TaxID=2728037 RepID=UPI0014741F29|nr:hypothetical protein [Tautonia rosea]
MKFKQNMIVATILTLLTIVFFVVASPLVPMASTDVWIVIALLTAGGAAIFWIAALQTRGLEETGSTEL